ncbi:MAG: ABC transporter substrate-binding protein [Chloroflexi bacterium]|nr:ABC transporter substrate-binding protein [Chloroflexota bacterium]MCL5274696.1 ABC transporter substrate-binding protein [Chloroflexota bacterium]
MNRSSSRFVAWFGRVLQASVAMIFVLLAACAASPTPAPQFTLRIGIFPVQDCLPYFVMREQGFDKQNGLQFVETTYTDGDAMIKAMGADSLDVGPTIGSVPVLSAAARGLIPGKIVPVAANDFADPDHPSVGVLVGRSINNWKDLDGQSIGVASLTSLHGTAMKGRLKQEGVRDYTLVEIPIPNLGLAIAGGNVAAASMQEPYLTQSLLRGDGRLLGWIIGGPPFERMEFTMIVFSAAFYRNNPTAVKAFLRAHLQAVQWINQHPKEARSILSKRLALSEEVSQKITLPNWPLDARNDPTLLDNMQPLLVEIGTIKAPIPARQLYDETLLDQVLAEKR